MMGYGRFGGGRGFGECGFGMLPHIIGMIVAVVILVLIVIFIVKMIKNKGGLFQYHKVDDKRIGGNALEILNERYAKGEIGEEEYQKIKAEILKT